MKAAYRATSAAALALFERVPTIRLAAIDDGAPLIRTVHGVVVDGEICFHGGAHGDKLAMLNQPAVAIAEEIVAEIPSYFVDPELACPATTYYRSAFAHGVLHPVRDLDRKARVLQALMKRFQPEGRHIPIYRSGHRPGAGIDPRYARSVSSLLVAALSPTQLVAKHKLGQNRGHAQIERVMTELWRRGNPGDVAAIRVIADHHPARPQPAFLRGPAEFSLCCAPDALDATAAAMLLTPQYAGRSVSREAIERAHRGSAAWVVARWPDGTMAGTARAIGDGATIAAVVDVTVTPDARDRGVERALLDLLLDHPRVRDCVEIRTGFDAPRPRAVA